MPLSKEESSFGLEIFSFALGIQSKCSRCPVMIDFTYVCHNGTESVIDFDLLLI